MYYKVGKKIIDYKSFNIKIDFITFFIIFYNMTYLRRNLYNAYINNTPRMPAVLIGQLARISYEYRKNPQLKVTLKYLFMVEFYRMDFVILIFKGMFIHNRNYLMRKSTYLFLNSFKIFPFFRLFMSMYVKFFYLYVMYFLLVLLTYKFLMYPFNFV